MVTSTYFDLPPDERVSDPVDDDSSHTLKMRESANYFEVKTVFVRRETLEMVNIGSQGHAGCTYYL